MKTVKILAISCSLVLLTGKLLAQTPTKAEAPVADTTKQVDAIDAFFAKYQAFLDKQKKPVAKNTINNTPQISQATVNQAALQAAMNRQNIDPLIKQTNSVAYDQAQQRAVSLDLNALTEKYDLVRAQSAPIVAPVVPKTLTDRQAQLQKAMAEKAALDKKAAEEAQRTDGKQ